MATKLIGNERIIGIIEVYYKSRKDSDKNKPDGYIDYTDREKNPLSGWSTPKEIKSTLKLMKKALKKTVIYDLDNWPNLFTEPFPVNDEKFFENEIKLKDVKKD